MTYRGEQVVEVGCLVRGNASHPLNVCDFHSATTIYTIQYTYLVENCSDDLIFATA